MGSLSKPFWKDVVAEKRAIRDAAIHKYLPASKEPALPLLPGDILPYTSEDVRSITTIDELSVLQERIGTGEWSAEMVISAYIKRAASVHEVTNCFTEVLFDEAYEHARKLDEYYKKNGRVMGPFHGVPVTVKDQFNVKGVDSTLGYVGRVGNPATEDAAIVQILRAQGAVILGKTNVPQSVMWCETENPLFGLTTHPRNPAFTPGGSTGGEGVLLSTHSTMIGWGTDIGGSVRIPAAHNGVYGLRPSSGRLPYYGVPVSTEGQEHVHSVVGPMTRSMAALKSVTKAVIDAEPWNMDPRCHPIPWREEVYRDIQSRPLVIGVMLDDGVVKVHPPIERAIRQVVAKLEAAGHEIVQWQPSGHQEVVDVLDAYYTADGGHDVRIAIEAGGEPFIPHVEALVNRGKAISVFEYWQLNRRKLAALKTYLDKWTATRGPSGRIVDVLLTPVAPNVAVPHTKSKWVGYTKVWNVLDYTALAFPATTVRKDIDVMPENYVPRNDQDAWNWGVYDKDASDEMPVGLQIVGRRLEEEKVLGAAQVIDALLKL